MDDDLARQGQLRRHQERRPVDRVEARDVLADHMRVGGPEFRPRAVVGKAGRGDVIGQRVDPDVHDVLGIAGNRHAPVEGRAADRDVGEPAPDEGDDLVAIFFRRDELGIGFVMREQLVGIGRQPEEIALLLDPLRRRAARRELGAVRAVASVRSRRNRLRRAPNTSRNISTDRCRRWPSSAPRSPGRSACAAPASCARCRRRAR